MSIPSTLPRKPAPRARDSQELPLPALGPSLDFALVLHAHQPSANGDDLIREVSARSYRPFCEKLLARPDLRLTLAFSGALLERLSRLDPGLIDLLRGLLAAGQVELLGGAFYEPLLPLIPQLDRQGQIRTMQRLVRDLFAVVPTGAWLPERWWDYSLVADLRAAGIEFTLVDETAFLQAGFHESELTHPFRTEELGQSLTLFPASRIGPYLLPFAEIDQIRSVLAERLRHHSGTIWLFADDLEKFGTWPGTQSRVHDAGWLDEFLDLLDDGLSGVRTVTLREALHRHPARGIAYPAPVAYRDLQRAALPPGSRNDQSLGGHIRHFLVRYPEVNLLHKRMLAASAAVHALPEPPDNLLDLVWQSQGSCAYWHSWFGGAYLPHLRLAARAAATRAEALALLRLGRSLDRTERIDVDGCGEDEILISSRDQWLLLKPRGATAVAWEDRDSGFDRLAGMNLSEEDGLPPHGPELRRLAFEDLILPFPRPNACFLEAGEGDMARFRRRSFTVQLPRQRRKHEVLLTAETQVPGSGGPVAVRLHKSYAIPESGPDLSIRVTFSREPGRDLEFTYGLRLPFAAPPCGRPHTLSFPELGLWRLDNSCEGEVSGITEMVLDAALPAGMLIHFSRPLSVVYRPFVIELPVEGRTTSLHQGVVLTFFLPLRLQADRPVEVSFLFKPGGAVVAPPPEFDDD